MLPNWIVVLPPLLVVTGVLLTKRMIPSFIAGIISAALIATKGNIIQALLLTCNKLWVSTGLDKLTSLESFLSSWNLLIFLFLISMGMLIALLSLKRVLLKRMQPSYKRRYIQRKVPNLHPLYFH